MLTPSSPKFTPPRRRSDTIRRDRLHKQLNDALEYDVIVVSAPAGYGKSTLLVDWISEIDLPVAWLSLDRLDRDPVVLLRDLAGAVQTVAGASLTNFEEHLRSGGDRADVHSVVATFGANVQSDIDDLFVLVIDDINALDDAQSSIDTLDLLIQSTPLNMRVVLLTRSWTTLRALPRLTAQRRAFTLAVRDMQFTDAESLDFVRRVGITDEGQSVGVVRRADGWAAALAILAEHYDPTRPSGSGSASEFILADFIDDEVIARLEPEHIDLLRACAILQSFDVDLVRSLSGHRDSARRLRELERSTHLIVRLEDASWYRIHAILREHIVAEMERENPEHLLELQRSASALYARRGMRREAVEMALQAGDWNEAVREIHEIREQLYQQGEWSTLVDWLDRLPEDILQAEPELAMTRARHALKLFDAHTGLTKIEAVRTGLGAKQQARRELYRSVALRHMGRLGDAVEACRLARSIARESLESSSPIYAEIDLEEGIAMGIVGNFPTARDRLASAAKQFETVRDHHRTAEAFDALGLTLGYLGKIPDALQALTTAQRLWRTVGDQRHQLSTMANMGDLQITMGEMETARDTFNAVVQRARDLRFVRGEAYGHLNLAIIEFDLGHLTGAADLYNIALQSAGQFDDPSLVASATCGLALVYREQGHLGRARTLVEHGLRSADQGGMLLYRAWFGGALGAIRADEGEFEAASAALEQALADAEAAQDPKERAIGHFRLADLAFRLRRRSDALAQLRDVAEFVSFVGYDTFLWSEARQRLDLLEFAIARRTRDDYFRNLLDRCRRVLPGERAVAESLTEASTGIRAEAFGVPRVIVDGRQISDLEWRSERSKEMFFFLLQSNRPVRKEQIAVHLWPDVAPEQVNSAFHSTLYRLRRAIDKQVVVQSDAGYHVNDTYEIAYDAREFEEHMRAAETEAAGSEEWSRQLAAALKLYRGPFAEPFESEWVQDARQRYEDRYLTTLTALAAQGIRSGRYDDALALTDLTLGIDPLNENAIRYQMQAHARNGHLELAAQTYRRYRERLRDDAGEEPPPDLLDVYTGVLSGAALDK